MGKRLDMGQRKRREFVGFQKIKQGHREELKDHADVVPVIKEIIESDTVVNVLPVGFLDSS
jgi:hypothetical protein